MLSSKRTIATIALRTQTKVVKRTTRTNKTLRKMRSKKRSKMKSKRKFAVKVE